MEHAGGTWSPEQFRAAVTARNGETRAVLELLDEGHPAYSQQSAAEVLRRRGWILATLGRQPLPECALPYVLEELQVGHSPYLMAAAARALRQSPVAPPAAAEALQRAADSLALFDDAVDLDIWGGTTSTGDAGTALCEVRLAQQWLAQAPAAGATNCCGLPVPWQRSGVNAAGIGSVRFEDENGQVWTWGQLFHGKPAIVAFFYSRCDNPLKCPLTLARMVQVQHLLQEAGLDGKAGIYAISYDPDFDLPSRLDAVARNRGLATGPNCHMLRATAGRETLAAYFASGVNFIGSIVNRHRTEVFLLDQDGRIVASCQRLAWEPQELARRLGGLLQRAPRRPGRASLATTVQFTPAVWALGLALLPKCPICGITYLSMGGVAALGYLPGWSRSWPVLLLMLLLNVGAVAWFARGRRQWQPLALAGAGAAMLAIPGLALGIAWAFPVGAAFTAAGSLLAVLNNRDSRPIFHWPGRPSRSP